MERVTVRSQGRVGAESGGGAESGVGRGAVPRAGGGRPRGAGSGAMQEVGGGEAGVGVGTGAADPSALVIAVLGRRRTVVVVVGVVDAAGDGACGVGTEGT